MELVPDVLGIPASIQIILVLLVFVVIAAVPGYVTRRNSPPGPMLTFPVLGHLPLLPHHHLHKHFEEMAINYGNIFSLKVGKWNVVVINGSVAVKEALKSVDFAGRPPFVTISEQTYGGKSISRGNYGFAWRYHRKVFVSVLRDYMQDTQLLGDRISDQVKNLLDSFHSLQQRAFDPMGIFMLSISNVISQTVFGKKFESNDPDFQEIIYCINQFFFNRELSEGWVDFLPWLRFFPNPTLRRTKELNTRMFTVFIKLLRQHEATFNPTELRDLIDVMLKKKMEAEESKSKTDLELLTDEYIVTAIENMFSAGYETTTTTLRWAMVYLVNNPHIQEAVYTELMTVVGPNRLPCLADRYNLPLVQATVLEVSRLASVAPLAIPHYTINDTVIGGYTVPKESLVFVNLWSVHHEAESFNEPEKFDPMRFITSDGKLDKGDGKVIPFSAGRRACPGEQLAKMELFLFIASILHQFFLAPPPGKTSLKVKGHLGITLIPQPYEIRVFPRHAEQNN